MERKKDALNTEPKERTRNLKKTDLGSVIFGCKHFTFNECVSKQLFGLPAPHFSYVRNVTPGMPLFLFNYSDRMLHGIYEAASNGQMNIDTYAWAYDTSETSLFPAQVRVKVRMQCLPLKEQQFKPIISSNYYDLSHFWFELDMVQTRKLLAMFRLSPAPLRSLVPRYTEGLGTIFHGSSSSGTGEGGRCQLETSALESPDVCLYSSFDSGNFPPENHILVGSNHTMGMRSWSSFFKPPSNSNLKEEAGEAPSVVDQCYEYDHKSQCTILENLPREEKTDECKVRSYGWEESIGDNNCLDNTGVAINSLGEGYEIAKSEENTSYKSYPELHASSVAPLQQEESHSEVAFAQGQGATITEVEGSMLHKDGSGCTDVSSNSEDVNASFLPEIGAGLACLTEEIIMDMTLPDLQSLALKLVQAVHQMKLSQCSQSDKIKFPKEELENSKVDNKTLEGGFQTCASSASLSTLEEEGPKLKFECNPSILLVGGYDGISCLSALDCYSPTQDCVKSLESMGTVRLYAAAAKLNDGVCVLGGGFGDLWYNTVEVYNPEHDIWISCTPLNKKKGSLAGIGWGNKLLALGGGDGIDCFSEIEMLDLEVGKWIPFSSMLQKRFALAAAEINGRIYMVGGYDGHKYLESVEAFDPRDRSRVHLQSMNTRRGCPCVTVLNEKLYALGGYDGVSMVTSVEVFDPRLNSWMTAEPMNNPRGNFGAATICGSIYAIGGVRDDRQILSTVERYSEGGWQVVSTKAIGKRSSFATVVL